MKKNVNILLLSLTLALPVRSFAQSPSAPIPALTAEILTEHIAQGMDFFSREQAPDGSWTRLIEVSSVMYNLHMVLLYEFLNKTDEKHDQVRGLMSYAWSRQNADGGFPGYTGGVSDPSISVIAYVAGRIAGESEDSARMSRLESFIHDSRALEDPGIALPYLMLFELNTDSACGSGVFESLLMHLDRELPWIKVILHPVMHLLATGQTHALAPEKFPSRLKVLGHCPKWLPHPFRATGLGEKEFWNWIDGHMNEDGTLFDYTPTTIPGLMALSTGGPKYADLLARGVRSLESFQVRKSEGIYQSPGEASVGETLGILFSLLEMGYTDQDPMVQRAENFLFSMQQAETGAFGFSKHNVHFPDTDDTGTATYVLSRLAKLRGHGKMDEAARKRLERAMDWLLTVQNSDGGFGTWDKNHLPIWRYLTEKTGVVVSESVPEHTARIVLALAQFKDLDPRYAASYQHAIQFLLKRQREDGSYAGTWFVDYLFGTAMVMNALGTAPASPGINLAIEKGLTFILSHQAADGGFSESPESFIEGRSIALGSSSPAQTGFIATQLLLFLESERGREFHSFLKPAMERAVSFLLTSQQPDGLWHDPTWTGVTFPKVEYLIYPYIQEMEPFGALAIAKRVLTPRNLGQ